MVKLVLLVLLLVVDTLNLAAQTILDTLQSPDGMTSVDLYQGSDSILCFDIRRNGKAIFEKCRLGFSVNGKNHCILNTDTIVNKRHTNCKSILQSDFGERKFQKENYNEYIVSFSNKSLNFDVVIRLYDRAFAIRYSINNNENFDFIDLTQFRLRKDIKAKVFVESKNEKGYQALNSQSGKSICPVFLYNDTLYCLVYQRQIVWQTFPTLCTTDF